MQFHDLIFAVLAVLITTSFTYSVFLPEMDQSRPLLFCRQISQVVTIIQVEVLCYRGTDISPWIPII